MKRLLSLSAFHLAAGLFVLVSLLGCGGGPTSGRMKVVSVDYVSGYSITVLRDEQTKKEYIVVSSGSVTPLSPKE